MSLFNPAYLWFLALAGPLILLYFLKLKRRPVAVSSTLLWERTIEDLRVNSPFQRLRGSLLLLLQLVALALLIVALARLFFQGDATPANYRVILIDTSASMGTVETEDGQTRLQRAIAAVTEQINHAPGDHYFCLMLFDRVARPPLVNFTNDKNQLMRALADVRPTDMGTDPQEALRLAESLASERNAEIHVFTDGGFAKKLRVHSNPRFTVIGEAGQNIGIINFAARRRATEPGRFDLAVQIANYNPLAVRYTLQILKDGQIIDVKQGTLLGLSGSNVNDARASFIIDDPRLTAGLVEAQLVAETPGADRFAADNVAYLVLPALTPRSVALVSDGHFYLEKILGSQGQSSSLAPEMSAIKIAVAEAKSALAGGHEFDVVIFDNVASEQMPDPLPPGDYVFVNCVPPGGSWGLTAPMLDRPMPLPPPDEHPLLKFVDINSLQIRQSPRLVAPEWAEPVLFAVDVRAEANGSEEDGGGASQPPGSRSRELPLIAIATRNERTTLVVGFDLFESNWPLQLSFPIFWANVLRYMFRGTVDDEVFALSTDASVSFARHTGSDEEFAVLRGPHNYSERVRVSSDNRFHFGHPGRVGVYQLSIGSRPAVPVALNLVNAEESAIKPRTEILVDHVGRGSDEVIRADTDIKTNVEYWPWLLLGAFAFLLVEWWIYHRRPFG